MREFARVIAFIVILLSASACGGSEDQPTSVGRDDDSADVISNDPVEPFPQPKSQAQAAVVSLETFQSLTNLKPTVAFSESIVTRMLGQPSLPSINCDQLTSWESSVAFGLNIGTGLEESYFTSYKSFAKNGLPAVFIFSRVLQYSSYADAERAITYASMQDESSYYGACAADVLTTSTHLVTAALPSEELPNYDVAESTWLRRLVFSARSSAGYNADFVLSSHHWIVGNAMVSITAIQQQVDYGKIQVVAERQAYAAFQAEDELMARKAARPAATFVPPRSNTATAIPATATPRPGEFLGGLTATEVMSALKNQGFQCAGPKDGAAFKTWMCINLTANVRGFQVIISGEADDRIFAIDAIAADSNLTSVESRAFLNLIAGLKFEGADPSAAQAWVAANLRKAPYAEKQYGLALFRMFSNPSDTTLQIGAVNPKAYQPR